jgi:hypothetical protein
MVFILGAALAVLGTALRHQECLLTSPAYPGLGILCTFTVTLPPAHPALSTLPARAGPA